MRSLRLCGLSLFLVFSTFAQIPSPKDVLGFTPGDDKKLASWAQVVDYFKRLDAASDRVMFEEIGKSTMGAPFVYATISSPENLKSLEKYRAINDKLADPRKIAGTRAPLPARDAAAKKLIAQGKTIVLITCGIHSTEVGSTLSSMLIAYRLALAPHPEVNKILDNTIILIVPSLNPDGVDIVKNWYDKTVNTPYEGTSPPELYHKYVGHDNNRDWYAFTQVETQLTVDKIHNVWHPQIVHDIHQQGQNGSRLFLPPYKAPVEPNVPKQIVEGYTELGNAMAATLRGMGYQGITTNSTYDAWTPARAYSHYHGGVRILSETASAKLATPITVKFDDLTNPPQAGYDPKVESANFGPVWKGGEWKLRNITDYMTTAAFTLMNHAADNRERWLTRFYEIGKEAVRPKKKGEAIAYIIDNDSNRNVAAVRQVLRRAGVEYDVANGEFSIEERGIWTTFSDKSVIIPTRQPYFGFVKALLEPQTYPDLRSASGDPLPPYDVTAHSLTLLTGTNHYVSSRKPLTQPRGILFGLEGLCRVVDDFRYRTYHSNPPSMDEGWTRWLMEIYPKRSGVCGDIHKSIYDSEFRAGHFSGARAIIFPDQSPAQILNGYAKGTMPDEYTGGVGKEGVENLKEFVEAGGTLVFLNRSTEFAIEQFNLPIRNVVSDLDQKTFFIPGSILRTELDLTHPIAKGMPQQSIAWFENGPVFEVVGTQAASLRVDGSDRSDGKASRPASQATDTQAGSLRSDVRIIARYPTDPKAILLSGWALGTEKIAGKAALIEVTMGKGKIILFGFRPQYRGQSLTTFPLLFNAISQ
ncbi:MAG: hypothetical protein KBD94_06920 [Pyrinomonadaceae bacterium]|nr:hypothetical protein [Pyrinomonadaceae bacterium]